MINGIFREADKLAMGMDASSMRAQTIAQNVANVDTPGYNRKTVVFEDYYRAALTQDDGARMSIKRTRDGHFPLNDAGGVPYSVQTDYSTTMRMDGNNVDIEKEMADAATNQIYYYTLQSKLASEFSQLRTAITGGQ